MHIIAPKVFFILVGALHIVGHFLIYKKRSKTILAAFCNKNKTISLENDDWKMYNITNIKMESYGSVFFIRNIIIRFSHDDADIRYLPVQD